MQKMTLGAYTFEYNPRSMELIETKKTVAKVNTYTSNAVFQWPPQIEGLTITLTWNSITEAMYDELRTLYVSTDSVVFDPQNGSTYNVIVEDLTATYYEFGLEDIAYRRDVALILIIQSAV